MGGYDSAVTRDVNFSEKQMVPEARDQDPSNEPPVVKTPVEARAGLVSGHIVTILIFGTILAIVLLGMAWAIFGAS